MPLRHGCPSSIDRSSDGGTLVVFEESNHVCFNTLHKFRPLTGDARLSDKKMRN
jgi:hypothetical protein